MAHALELVGERWSLPIARELMFGPRRFGELKRDLHGISANVLAQRLEGLERAGIVRRVDLPSPANVQAYDLTDWGREAEAPMLALSRWALRSTGHDPRLPLSPASMMLSLRTMYVGGGGGKVGFRLGPDRFLATLTRQAVEVERGDPEAGEAVITGRPNALLPFFYGGRPLTEVEAGGDMIVTGDRVSAARLPDYFRFPAKADG